MERIKFMLLSTALCFLCSHISAQLPVGLGNLSLAKERSTSLTRKFLTPTRIVWTSDNNSGKYVQNPSLLLKPGIGQIGSNSDLCFKLISDSTACGGIILDFGSEIQGGLEFVCTARNKNPAARVRVRMGESVGETMSNIAESGATNDHAIRDFTVTLPFMGRLQVGESGFRFARIDLIDPGVELELQEVSAIFSYRDIPYLGSFKSNDDLLNEIWMTGAYTVHLNMQDYLWDGIKRDRLVWLGDLHPEVMTVNTVFGNNEVVPKSLDLIREITPLPGWMNGISSYSMWWIIIQQDWFLYQGDLAYLKEQHAYLKELLGLLSDKIDENGSEKLDGWRFLDWPSSKNEEAIHAGLQSLMVISFDAGIALSKALKDKELESLCRASLKKLGKHIPELTANKQSASLLSLSGLLPARTVNDNVLSKDGVHGMSTFYGYYMLNAQAKAGDYTQALNNIREYWGGMIKLGATSFWEDFDINWLENAARIDEVVPPGKVDVHASYGDYCYKGYRHSFCHGWASGPTAWLSRYVLGVTPLEPGCTKVRISPNLGDLKWVEGTFPTPMGVIKIRHEKQANGEIKSQIDAPKGVEVVI